MCHLMHISPFYLLGFLIVSLRVHAHEKNISLLLPNDVFHEIIQHSVDFNTLKSSKTITELYSSLGSLNAFTRCSKNTAYYVNESFKKSHIELDNKSIKEFFRHRLNQMNESRSEALYYWESDYLQWIFPLKYEERKYSKMNYQTFPPSVCEYFEKNKIDINQPLLNVLHQYYDCSNPKTRELENILPLQIACISKQIPDIRFLLRLNANPNKKDREGRNALIFLVSDQYTGYSQGLEKTYLIAQLLLKHGTDIDMQDARGKTALMYAFQEYFVECDLWEKKGGVCQVALEHHLSYNIPLINLLLDAPGKLNLKDNEGNTALFYALRYFHSLEIISKMLAQGAGVNIKNNKGETPLLLAQQYHNSEVASLIHSHTSSKYERLTYAGNNPFLQIGVGMIQNMRALFQA